MRDESTVSSRRFAWALSSSFVALAMLACSSTSAPGGNGDRLIVDSKTPPSATTPPPPPDDDGGFPRYDAAHAPDGYAPFNACKKCSCPGGQYCLGGVSGMTDVVSCPAVAGSTTLKAGCNELPPECAAKPDCACILQALHGQFPCYPVCSDLVGGFTVYCPVP